MGKQRIKCHGHKTNGDPCPNWAMNGQMVCHAHGGRAPQNKAAAAERVTERKARELFGKIAPDPAPIDNPLAAYAQLAGRVIAWLDLMDSLLDDLRAVGYESEYVGVQIQAIVQLYERAMDRANTVLGSYARLKIDERLAAITEAQKTAVIRAINAALDEAGLHEQARENATRAAARHLRAA